jgi:hypothetical protein
MSSRPLGVHDLPTLVKFDIQHGLTQLELTDTYFYKA